MESFTGYTWWPEAESGHSNIMPLSEGSDQPDGTAEVVVTYIGSFDSDRLVPRLPK